MQVRFRALQLEDWIAYELTRVVHRSFPASIYLNNIHSHALEQFLTCKNAARLCVAPEGNHRWVLTEHECIRVVIMQNGVGQLTLPTPRIVKIK
jgi:hypothetical protein